MENQRRITPVNMPEHDQNDLASDASGLISPHDIEKHPRFIYMTDTDPITGQPYVVGILRPRCTSQKVIEGAA